MANKLNDDSHVQVVRDDAQPAESGLAELREQLAEAGAPARILRMVDESEDPTQVIDWMLDNDVVPSPADSVGGLLNGWAPLLEADVRRLDAELCGVEFLGMLRQLAPEPEAVPGVLTDMIEDAAKTGRPEALAMLRVFSVLGPPEIRPSAIDRAERMVSAGLRDQPWVPGLGRPEVGVSCGYRNTAGGQEAVACNFAYDGEPHALVVLIDHNLGGGVKDCFVSDDADQIRAEYRRTAKRFDFEFKDYEPAEAAEILTTALNKPPCPVAHEQFNDVRFYLDLLHSRITLLKDGTVTVPENTENIRVHKLKIALQGFAEPIWRRLEVPSAVHLTELHTYIQDAFGWDGSHMWSFDTPQESYSIPTNTGYFDPDDLDAEEMTLIELAGHSGSEFSYTYDFSDGWKHLITVEEITKAEAGIAYPRCVAGRQAAPPESSGGTTGYQAKLEVLADPAHPEHGQTLEWMGLDSARDFDPADFQVAEVNKALSSSAVVFVG